MEKYLIKKAWSGFFLNVSVWRKEWSDSIMSNTTTLIDSKKFLFNNRNVNIWLAKKILEDLTSRDRMEIYDNGKSRTFTTSA